MIVDGFFNEYCKFLDSFNILRDKLFYLMRLKMLHFQKSIIWMELVH
jgi:hypothetical protein